MYKNVGKKIMKFAQILGIVCLCTSVISAFALFIWLCGLIVTGEANDALLYSSLISLISSIVGFFPTWFLYGFGQIVEQIDDFHKNMPNKNVSINGNDLPEL